FLLWQLAYTELWFTPVLWPDLDAATLQQAFDDFAARERRFGLTGDQVARAPATDTMAPSPASASSPPSPWPRRPSPPSFCCRRRGCYCTRPWCSWPRYGSGPPWQGSTPRTPAARCWCSTCR